MSAQLMISISAAAECRTVENPVDLNHARYRVGTVLTVAKAVDDRFRIARRARVKLEERSAVVFATVERRAVKVAALVGKQR